jgi:filamentous hemagglutinin
MGGEASFSFSNQKQNAHGNYASVNEQSGLFAGSGGFDLTVGGNTALVGAVIDSAAAADQNSLVTGSLTTSDLANHSDYSAQTGGFGAGVSFNVDIPARDENGHGHSIFEATGISQGRGSLAPSLPLKEDGQDNSLTRSAVAEGTVVITDEAAQQARTGQTAAQVVASLNRDTQTAHQGPLTQNPDLGEILEKQAEIVDAAGQAGPAVARTAGDIAKHMLMTTGDEKWAEGGAYKILLQAAGSALVAELGNGEGLNAASSSAIFSGPTRAVICQAWVLRAVGA